MSATTASNLIDPTASTSVPSPGANGSRSNSNRGRNRSARAGGNNVPEVAESRESNNSSNRGGRRGGRGRGASGASNLAAISLMRMGGTAATISNAATTSEGSNPPSSSAPLLPPARQRTRRPASISNSSTTANLSLTGGRPQRSNNEPSNRRARFNASLSSSTGHLDATSAGFSPAPVASITKAVDPASQTLAERLTSELTAGTLDCSICFSTLSRTAQIHSCSTCYTPFHLTCINKWANHSITETSERAQLLATRSNSTTTPEELKGNWRCPACQSTFSPDLLPRQYRCFCGRTVNPSAKGTATPHSCGNQCSRPRKDGCNHPCQDKCHPGPCVPCSIVVEQKCHCGKKDRIRVRCSAINGPVHASATSTKAELLSCKSTCGRKLKCGKHECEKTCHEGDCGDCERDREKKCYCGRESVKEKCGDVRTEARVECVTVGGEEKWEGEWSCDRICDATYDCNHHSCPLTCHPHSSHIAQPCPFSPTTLKTCPCSATPLSTLLIVPRSSCLSPIPTCNNQCSKILECGHECRRKCHNGACGECDEQIVIVCRCGSSKASRRCADRHLPITQPSSVPPSKVASTSATPTATASRTPMPMFISSVDLPPSPDELRCQKVCRAMKSCGRHECGRKCCPLSYQEALRAKGSGGKSSRRRGLDQALEVEMVENDTEGVHACDRMCGRKLSCGSHTCEARDHKGPCPPCLRAGFEELICNCGSTIMLPPIACNTKIDCRHPCIRPSLCGHPKVPHACHEDESCPPCPFLTTKPCACGKITVANVRCSSDPKRVSCGTACGKLLRCGFHRCLLTCHVDGLCLPCDQICLKPRRCGHPCPEDCHAPSACPFDTPCPKLIEVFCACGTIKQQARCGANELRPEGNKERTVKCTDTCIIAKRNLALAEALGIEKEKREAKVRLVEYEPLTLSYAKDNLTWSTNLEATLTEFMTSDKPAIHLPVMKRPQREFVHGLAEHFDLRSESLDEEPHRSIVIHRTSTSCIPSPTLTEALLALKKNGGSVLNLGSLRKVVPERMPNNALLLDAVGGYDREGLQAIVSPWMRGLSFKLDWVTEEDVLISFETPELLSPTGLELRIALIQNSLISMMGDNHFCKYIEIVRLSPEDGTIIRGSWTSVSNNNGPSGGGAIKAISGHSGRLFSQNSFAALGTSMIGGVMGEEELKARNLSAGSIVSGGLHRPPKSVVGSISSLDRPNPPPLTPPVPSREEENVPDSWEEEEETAGESTI